MKRVLVIFIISIISMVSCNKTRHYEPQGLRKLSHEEILERFKAGTNASEKVVFKDSIGNLISEDDIYKMNIEEVFGDQYVNSENEVVEVVIRRATAEDKALITKINEFSNKEEPVTIIDVDCAKVREILESVYENDQAIREQGSVNDASVDKENQQIVVSIIESCGFPTVEEHGSKSVQAAFVVIQHAGKSLREKYFDQIKKSADQGDLERRNVALMEDRMLMDRGEKQKYGSQVQKINGSDDWTLYPVEDLENVNKRRQEVGLGPIEEYLKHFDIDYKVVE